MCRRRGLRAEEQSLQLAQTKGASEYWKRIFTRSSLVLARGASSWCPGMSCSHVQ